MAFTKHKRLGELARHLNEGRDCINQDITILRGQPHGRVVKFARSASAAHGFTSSDPGWGHGTTHQAMLRWHPTCHNQKDPQLKIHNYVRGALGRKRKKEKKKKETVSSYCPQPLTIKHEEMGMCTMRDYRMDGDRHDCLQRVRKDEMKEPQDKEQITTFVLPQFSAKCGPM